MKHFILFIFVSSYFWGLSLKPDRNYISHPDTLGLKYDSQRIKTSDNLELQAWILRPMTDINRETSIILAYGDAGNMSYWLNQAAILSQSGYTVILFDYRGFGESSDFVMNENQLYYDEFTQDLKSVYDWTKSNVKNQKIGLWGLSMGTIMTGFLLNEVTPDFLILEGLVVKPQNIQLKIEEAKGKKLILPDNAYQLNDIFANTTVPMLIFSGEDDQFTTVEDANEIAKINVNRTSITYKGGHLEGFQSMTKEFFGEGYVKEMNSFLIKIPVGK